jgi:hypothetical protein
MLSLIAFVIALIGAILAWVDKTISVQHLIALVFVVLALVALGGLWTWSPWGPANRP